MAEAIAANEDAAREEESFLTTAEESDKRAEEALNRRVPPWIKLLIGASLAGIMVLSFAVGRYPIGPVELFQTIGGLANNTAALFLKAGFGISIPTCLLYTSDAADD